MNCNYCGQLLEGNDVRQKYCIDKKKPQDNKCKQAHYRQMQKERESLRLQELEAARQQIEHLQEQVNALATARLVAPPVPNKKPARTIKKPAKESTMLVVTPQPEPKKQQEPGLEHGEIWLYDFADVHHVGRNDAQGLWLRGNMPTARKVGVGRKMRVALDTKGQRDAWAQFKALSGFGKCDGCPHTL